MILKTFKILIGLSIMGIKLIIYSSALKLAQYLAEKTNSILVNTKYRYFSHSFISRLFCDVNRQI